MLDYDKQFSPWPLDGFVPYSENILQNTRHEISPMAPQILDPGSMNSVLFEIDYA